MYESPYHLRARPWPVPTPWYASYFRACGHTSEPQAHPEGLPTVCPRCEEA